MIRAKSPISITLFCVALSLEVVLSAGLAKPLGAQTTNNILISKNVFADVNFDPPGEGKPSDTAGGASRGNGCTSEEISTGGCFTPLMPASMKGLTTVERPTFLVYIPQNSGTKQVFFSLVDENNQNVYQDKISVTASQGIMAIKLPSNVALEVGKNYKWTFIAIGEQGLRPDSLGIQGTVKRIELTANLQNQLTKASTLEQAGLYSENKIWFDTASTLAELRKTRPDDKALESNWKDLLSSVGLGAIATKPLL